MQQTRHDGSFYSSGGSFGQLGNFAVGDQVVDQGIAEGIALLIGLRKAVLMNIDRTDILIVTDRMAAVMTLRNCLKSPTKLERMHKYNFDETHGFHLVLMIMEVWIRIALMSGNV